SAASTSPRGRGGGCPGVTAWLGGRGSSRRREALPELLERGVQSGLDLVVDLLLLAQRVDQRPLARIEELEQLDLVRAHLLDRNRIQVAVGRGVDDDDLLLDRQRLVLRLLQHLDE